MATGGAREPLWLPPVLAGEVGDPEGLGAWMRGFLEALRVRHYSAWSLRAYASHLGFFLAWCTERGLTRPGEITRALLERYQRALFLYRQPDGEPLSARSQHCRLAVVRGYFKWLVRQGVLTFSPASDLELPRLERRLPRNVMTPAEVEAVLALPDLSTPQGVRDRAILEAFYSTGMRRSELAGLGVFDLDAARGLVAVREGKGKKDRVVPIGERAVAWIRKYMEEVRPSLVVRQDPGALFLTHQGKAFTPNRLTVMSHGYIHQAKLGKAGACHLWRHSCATAMLENGADIRHIQEILGHEKLTSTQIYTHVSVAKLKAVHSATHPSARLTMREPPVETQPEPEASVGAGPAPVYEGQELALEAKKKPTK